ncbi:hypothetical protein IV203_004020 [Nitzschia inconspicua]|uniref:Uncharacterized protein n=1 Tax=Nitzschia inconspicua TaxID=303405 RepID=A0A9K3L2Z0_9STRA|nr:hypothetical protein IV203_004020 [Nitzschia inconspicua]
MRVTFNFSDFNCLHGVAIGSVVAIMLACWNGNLQGDPEVRVAMIGNSLMYYNDLPRLLETMSGGSITQDSCLHGDASFKSHLTYGNGMFEKWNTGQARMWDVDKNEPGEKQEQYYEYAFGTYYDDAAVDQEPIYDYGACTVEQLLLGVDERLVEEYGGIQRHRRTTQQSPKQQRITSQQQHSQQSQPERTRRRLEDAAAAATDDAVAATDDGNNQVDDAYVADANDDGGNYNAYDDATATTTTKTYDDDLYKDTYNEKYPLQNDGTNPCLLSANYYFYKQQQYDDFGPPQWDYIILNDNSRAPCCTEQRATGLELLKEVYVPWFIETGAVPIFMVTHGYWASRRDMSGLTDIPTFASLTYEGYREYAEMVGELLPPEQEPRLAPVGLAFQMIWEENISMWENLIHMDEIHLTPSGTFLEGLIVYATIYGHLPNPRIVLNGDIANLFSNARRMTPSEHIQEAYPTLDQARYLYHVASRIINGEVPRSFILYENGESADFVPNDENYESAYYNRQKQNNNRNNNNNNDDDDNDDHTDDDEYNNNNR